MCRQPRLFVFVVVLLCLQCVWLHMRLLMCMCRRVLCLHFCHCVFLYSLCHHYFFLSCFSRVPINCFLCVVCMCKRFLPVWCVCVCDYVHGPVQCVSLRIGPSAYFCGWVANASYWLPTVINVRC